ncbi:MAG: M23 family metallopeptidase [Brevinematales bacterium]|jgi:murein DD-endopeptidase MepM/ murein hydrolase activator NlpD
MANYSKKRPVFKSKAEMYKKSRWMKFKEVVALYYSNIKRSFAKLLYKINEKGSQRLTIMVVPHSEKKIVNIQISNYILFSFSVLLGITIGASVLAIGQTNHNQKQYDFLIRDDDLKQRQIEDFKTQIESFDKRFTSLKVDITNIIRSVGKDKNVYNYDNIEIPDNDSTNSTARQTKILNKLKNDLEVTKNNVVRIGKCIEEWDSLLNSIPSKYPLPERVAITSPFGLRVDPVFTWRTEFHPGVDLAAFPGTPILAAADGQVISAGWLGGYGLQVEIRHKYGFSTRYAHMEEIGPGVVPGAQIRQGQVVGYVGMTGKVTGPHLHFEVLIGESQIDPVPFTTMMMP